MADRVTSFESGTAGRLSASLLVAVVVCGGAFRPAGAESYCADCHFANLAADSYGAWAHHVREWDVSPHGRAGVGCERCHGGDATTFDPVLAHRGVLSSRNPASGTAPSRLPATCGACHPGPLTAYRTSRHHALLEQGDLQVARCTTCHGTVGAHLPSAGALASRCEHCHGEGGRAPLPQAPGGARALLEGVRAARSTLRQARSLIERLDPGPRRERLMVAWRHAEAPLIESVAAGHAFVFEDAGRRLDTARERAEALLGEILEEGGDP